MDTPYSIRELRTSDIPSILEIETLCFSHPWSIESFRGVIDSRIIRNAGILTGSELAGYIITMYGAGELHILNIAVKPDSQRRGLAGMLLDYIMDYYSNDLNAVLLEVRKSNFKATKFYLKRGFLEAGIRKNYYPDGEDAILMTLLVDKTNSE